MSVNNIPKEDSGITTLRGLLYINGREMNCLEADMYASKYGYVYAEQLVKAMELQRGTCGFCGGTSVTDLGHGRNEGTIICNNLKCKAKFWRKWYTASEWERYINATHGGSDEVIKL
jgi:hypothetical protein